MCSAVPAAVVQHHFHAPKAGCKPALRQNENCWNRLEIPGRPSCSARTRWFYLDRATKLPGKPTSRAEAARTLEELQGRVHGVITGVCLLHLRGHRQRVFAEWINVIFHPLTAQQIKDYLALTNPLDKAGAYAIQEHGERIVAEISGSYSNVVGLPVERVREELGAW